MRLLMIHGYAQNDEIFRAKSRRFGAYMHSTYPHAELIWAGGPLHLHPDDIAETSEDEEGQEDQPILDFRAWFYQHVPGRSLEGLSKSLLYLAELLQRHGPFDGVVGFSQGSVMAVILASLLQGDTRRRAYEALPRSSDPTMPYPAAFSHLAHPPLKFGILFCPGLLRIAGMEWLWDDPGLSTPFCRFVGSWDTVVSDIQCETVLEMTATKGLCYGDASGRPLSSYKREFLQAPPFLFRENSRLKEGACLSEHPWDQITTCTGKARQWLYGMSRETGQFTTKLLWIRASLMLHNYS